MKIELKFFLMITGCAFFAFLFLQSPNVAVAYTGGLTSIMLGIILIGNLTSKNQ